MTKKVYHGETPEEIANNIAGNIDEKYQKSIMDFINKAMKKPEISSEVNTGNPVVKKIQIYQADESRINNGEIVIVRTATSTLIAPVLKHSAVKTDISIEISAEGENPLSSGNTSNSDGKILPKVVDNTEMSLFVENNTKSQDGIIPLLVIPHRSEDNDNESSISQILDYFQKYHSEDISIGDFDFSVVHLSGKLIIIK